MIWIQKAAVVRVVGAWPSNHIVRFILLDKTLFLIVPCSIQKARSLLEDSAPLSCLERKLAVIQFKVNSWTS